MKNIEIQNFPCWFRICIFAEFIQKKHKKNIYSVTDCGPSYKAVHTIVHQATA